MCGSPYHDTKNCEEHFTSYIACQSNEILRIKANKFSDNEDFSLIDYAFGGPYVKCMVCKQLGHVSCINFPPPTEVAAYCPSCGEEGHHIDYMDDFPNCECYAPRIEAYIKFPKLLKDIGRINPGNRNDFYANVLRDNDISYDIGLQYFPSLRFSGGGNSNRGNNKRKRYDSSSDEDYNDYNNSVFNQFSGGKGKNNRNSGGGGGVFKDFLDSRQSFGKKGNRN